jgi:hypothetical protein
VLICWLFIFTFSLRFGSFRLGFFRFGLVAQSSFERAHTERRAFFATNGDGDRAQGHGDSFVIMVPEYALMPGELPAT